jgi:hypothetical protein
VTVLATGQTDTVAAVFTCTHCEGDGAPDGLTVAFSSDENIEIVRGKILMTCEPIGSDSSNPFRRDNRSPRWRDEQLPRRPPIVAGTSRRPERRGLTRRNNLLGHFQQFASRVGSLRPQLAKLLFCT